jgi:glycosyltransferase involved in cell wall biosynthesis
MLDYCRENNIERHVEFTGQLAVEQVWKWMSKSKVFILPSIREPLGASLVEAMANRCYCIASRIGGIPELVTPERGSLFEAGDYKKLAGLIADFFSNEEKYASQISSAYKFVKENCSIERTSELLNEIFGKLLRLNENE